jgi:signal transduction histidine kinase
VGRSLLRSPFDEVFPLVSLDGARERLRSPAAIALAGETVRGASVGLRLPEGERTLLLSAAPLHGAGGRIVGCVITMADVTEQRRIEEALRDSDRRKNRFLAVLSHELRNPLAPIKNSLFILSRSAPGEEKARRALGVAGRQVEQLARLVDDLLDLTRISNDKIQLKVERLDLVDVVRRTVEDFRSLFEQSGVALEAGPCDGPAFVLGDGARIAQVIGNLLQNAAKFTERGGHTVVSLGRTAGGQALIRVVDDGAGMAPDTVASLFEPFAQADRTLARSQGGLGLGLALVKGIVEQHGGSVSAHSAGSGQGSEFVVILPLAPVEEADPDLPRTRSS